jgi:predicted Rdx family selenoprotein
MTYFDDLLKNFTGADGEVDLFKGLVTTGGAYALNKSGLMKANIPQSGYQGGIPEYEVNRQRVPSTYDPNRRAGSGGQRYFTDTQYLPKSAAPAAPMSAEGLAALNASNPAQQMRRPGGPRAPQTPTPNMKAKPPTTEGLPSVPNYDNEVVQMAAGGIAELKKGKYLDGASDGMADKVPARIDEQQEARLSDGEFVIPADVVSHLGNGNSDAGAKFLSDMMAKVRKARTGNEKQGKEIDPNKFFKV